MSNIYDEDQATSYNHDGMREISVDVDSYKPLLASIMDSITSYIATELKCLHVIATRVVNINNKITKLQNEVKDYKDLDMYVVVADIEGAIKKLQDNRGEDVESINSILDTLTGHLGEHSYLYICFHLYTRIYTYVFTHTHAYSYILINRRVQCH